MSTVSKGIILVADDCADDIFLISRAFNLAKLGYSLATVSDGEEVLDFLANNELPKLLLLDLKMPRLSGFEVLAWIKSQPGLHEKLPVVVLSSSVLEDDQKRAEELGARDYIVKTGSTKELLRVIEDLNVRFLMGHQTPETPRGDLETVPSDSGI